jgi:O-antigen/teichoic acid export membrane protein
VLIVLKSVESVFICALRAYERYAPAVQTSVATRLVTILVCVALTGRGFGVPVLMGATLAVVSVGVFVQWATLRHLGHGLFRPAFDRRVYRELSSFGAFSWLQAVSGVIFSQADRLLLGVTLGASAVSYYGICVQLTQPIHGLTASALHFLFPHLALRFASRDVSRVRRPIFLALTWNFLMAATLAGTALLLGRVLLAHWVGPAFASQSAALLPLLVAGFFLLALNVTGHYALLALGRVRIVTSLNVVGGIVMLIAIAPLVRVYGVSGAALARLSYGPITCLLYLPLLRQLFTVHPTSPGLVGGSTEQA